MLGVLLFLFSCTSEIDKLDETQNNGEYIEFTFSTNNSRANVNVMEVDFLQKEMLLVCILIMEVKQSLEN